MIVVSGCPRSGTSMMMRIMQRAFGDERILGTKVPRKQTPLVPEGASEIKRYLMEKQHKKNPERKGEERTKRMNPNGYFEMAFCVKGVFWQPQYEEMLDGLLAEEQKSVCKIVSQGLARSDPRFIDKIVFMARDPRSVAKSQEQLGRDTPMNPEDAPETDGKKVLIRSVDMFNQVTVAAARWIDAHPEIPVHLVNYDELLDDPISVLAALEEFLEEGDFFTAHELIDTSLRRSTPENIEGDAAEFAHELFTSMLNKDWTGIGTKMKDRIKKRRDNPPLKTRWLCPRVGSSVSATICGMCKTHEQTLGNLIKSTKVKQRVWEKEPCPFECGIQDGVGLTIEQSVMNNHWSAYLQSTQVIE